MIVATPAGSGSADTWMTSPMPKVRHVDRHLDRDVARLGLDVDRAHHDAELTAVDRALRLADEVERDARGDFLVRIDREEVDVRDVAAQRIDSVLLDQRAEPAARGTALDREIDDRVLLADRVERGAQRLDVDRDRERLDLAVGRGAVADPRNVAGTAKRARGALALAEVVANGDGELSDFHGVSLYMNSELIESPW